MSRVGNLKFALVSGKWDWASNSLQISSAGVRPQEFSSLSRRGSIRLGGEVARTDLFCGPETRITAHLTPKCFDLSVRLKRKGILSGSAGNTAVSWEPLIAVTPQFLVIDKPPGIPSIEPADNPEAALCPHWLRRTLPRQYTQGYLSITGRLDAGTHGLMVISRSRAFTGLFNKEVQARRLKKRYTAVVSGWDAIANPKHKLGLWNHFYVRRSLLDVAENDVFRGLSPGQGATVEYVSDFDKMRFVASRTQQYPHTVPVQLNVVAAQVATSRSKALRCFHPAVTERMLRYSRAIGTPLVELQIDLITGKTHQIRAQLWAEGLSIVGDWLYGSHDMPSPDTFALCCSELGWTCPMTGQPVEFAISETISRTET